MSLHDLRKKLYEKTKPGEETENRTDYGQEKLELVDINKNNNKHPDLWSQKKGKIRDTQRRAIEVGALSVFVIIFLVMGLTTFLLIRKSMFNLNKMGLEIIGADKVQSGELVIYEIKYKNDNWRALKGALLNVTYPESFKPEGNSNFTEKSSTEGFFDLNLIKSHSEGKVILQGKTYNPKGALMYIKTNLEFKPANSDDRVSIGTQMGVNVLPSPINLEILAPQSISAGDAMDYEIKYENGNVEDIEDLFVKIEYPENFTYSNSNPPPLQGTNNVWRLDKLVSGESGKIVVSGRLDGVTGNIKNTNVSIGFVRENEFISINEEKIDTKIVEPVLTVRQTVNGSEELIANAGDRLEFTVSYKNNGNIGLKDVIITEKIDSELLDLSGLKIEGGNFDVDNDTITWKASGISELKNLEPGKSGEIHFKVNLKEKFPIEDEFDKNFIVSSIAKIDSPDIPTPLNSNKIISGNKIDIKVNSKLALNVEGYYNDDKISNSGPIPPRIGEETTYTLHWKVYNIFNDVTEAKVEAVIPPSAEMTRIIYPEDARIEYNERDNRIVWNIGNINSGTGVVREPLEVRFQVKIKPSPDKLNYRVPILGESIFTALDVFTGEDLKVIAKSKTTNLPEDEMVIGRGRVSQ